MAEYFGSFGGVEDVVGQFCIESKDLDGVNILVAWYGQEDYEGTAFVLFEKDGKLYEVNGSHCSCMGLEEQWEPEETTVEALMHRVDNGYGFHYDDGEQARTAVIKFCESWK